MRRLAVLLLCAVLVLAGCGGKPEITKVVLTDQVDAKQAPVRSVESFPEGARTFYVSVLVENPSQGTEVRVRWQFEGKLVDEASVQMPDSTDRWVSFDLKAAQAFPRGRYKAEVFLGRAPIRTVEFLVN